MKKVKDYFVELSLIVIGVLIAISVDDFRERSRTREMLQSYSEVMKNDLRENLALLDDEIFHDSVWLQRLSLITDKMTLKDFAGIDTLALYLTGHSSFNINDTGFRMIMQSGESHKLETEQLVRLNNLFGASMTDLSFFQAADLDAHRLTAAFLMKHHMRLQESLRQGNPALETELTNLVYSRIITMGAEREQKKKLKAKIVEIIQSL